MDYCSFFHFSRLSSAWDLSLCSWLLLAGPHTVLLINFKQIKWHHGMPHCISSHFVGCGYSLWTVYYLVSLILCAVLCFCRGAVLLKIRISSFFFFFIVFFNGPIGKGSGDNLLFLFYCLFNECKIQFYLLHGIILMAQYVKKKVKISRLIF